MSEISAENVESTEKPENSNETNEELLKVTENIQDPADISDSQQISSSSPQNDNETNDKTCSENQSIEPEAQETTLQTVNETKTCLANEETELEKQLTPAQTVNETDEAQNDNSSPEETVDATRCYDSSVEDTKAKCSANESNREDKDTPSESQYAEHVTYTADGTAIYTDPKTNYKYKWCTKANNWIPHDNSNTSANPYENEHYKWCNETQKWIPKQTQVTETEHYKWDSEKNEWVPKAKPNTIAEEINPKEIVYEIDDEGQRTYTDKDGTVFFWDEEKSAWFPKIDDDFMARYQMSYGFIDNTSASEKEKEKQELALAVEKEKELAEMVAEAKANEEASKDLNKQGLKRKGQQEPPSKFYLYAI